MSTRILSALLAGALLAGAAPRLAAADPTDEQIKAVEHCLTGIWGKPPRYLDRVYAARDIDKGKQCAAAARAVVDAGGAARDIRQPDGKPARADKVLEYTLRFHDALRVAYMQYEIEKAQKTYDWYGTLEEVGEDDMYRIDNDGKACIVATNEVTAMGLAPTTPIEVKPGTTLTFAQVKTDVCGVVAQLGKDVESAIASKEKADLDKKLAPFRKLLGGDKITTYVDKGMYDLEVYTTGGALMETPEHFKAASVWFQVLGYTDDLGRDWWTLRRFQFKGTTLVKQSESTGQGRTPPSSRYR